MWKHKIDFGTWGTFFVGKGGIFLYVTISDTLLFYSFMQRLHLSKAFKHKLFYFEAKDFFCAKQYSICSAIFKSSF